MLYVLKKTIKNKIMLFGLLVIVFVSLIVMAQEQEQQIPRIGFREASDIDFNTDSLIQWLQDSVNFANRIGRYNYIHSMLDSFPMWNSTWLFGKGDNENIYPTYSKSVPTHLIKVTFPAYTDDDSISMSYAFLNAYNYKSTSHMINDVYYQFQRNKVSIQIKEAIMLMASSKDSIISISNRTAPDTLWTCDRILTYERNLFPRGGTQMIRSYSDSLPWSFDRVDTSKWVWFKDKPYIENRMLFDNEYVEENFQAASDVFEGLDEQNLPIYYFKDKSVGGSGGVSGRIDYCVDGGGNNKECYEYSPCNGPNDFKVPDFRFWQVHLMPVVKFFPRFVTTGKPILNDFWAMSFGEAYEARTRYRIPCGQYFKINVKTALILILTLTF
jgi:hypothetical protein